MNTIDMTLHASDERITEEFLSIVYTSYTDNELLQIDTFYGTHART